MKTIAARRMLLLYKKALEIYPKDPNLARRYIYILWKIKLKSRLKLPKNLRNKFCKKCFTLWILGKTVSIRIRKGRRIYRCLNCGYIKRIPFKN